MAVSYTHLDVYKRQGQPTVQWRQISQHWADSDIRIGQRAKAWEHTALPVELVGQVFAQPKQNHPVPVLGLSLIHI